MNQMDHKIRALKGQGVTNMCKVKSHSGNPWNEAADSLALCASRKKVSEPDVKRRKRRWRSGMNSMFEAHGAQTASSNPLIAIFPAASL